MKKLLLTLMLAAVSSSAMAEWVEIGTSDNYETIIYADPTTIRKSGYKVSMWVLHDFNSVEEDTGVKFLSQKTQVGYDCMEEQEKILYYSWHSENMGRGDVVWSKNKPNLDWTPVIPESMRKPYWKFACGKLWEVMNKITL